MKKNFIFFLFFACANAVLGQEENTIVWTRFPYSLNGKHWGYCDTARHTVIVPRYDSACFFQTIDKKVLAIVGVQKKYGLIDTMGKQVLPFEYDEIRFCEKLLVLRKKNKRFLADSNGKFIQDLVGEPTCLIPVRHTPMHCILPPPLLPIRLNPSRSNYEMERAHKCNNGIENTHKMIYIVQKNAISKQIDTLYRIGAFAQKYDHERYEKEFEWCTSYYGQGQGWTPKNDILKKDNKYSLKSTQINSIKLDTARDVKTIEFIVYQTPFEYDSIQSIKFGFWVKKDNKYGIINAESQILLPTEYDYLDKELREMHYANVLCFKKDGLLGLKTYPFSYNFNYIPPRYTQFSYSYFICRIAFPDGRLAYLVHANIFDPFSTIQWVEMLPNGKSFPENAGQ